MGDVRLSSSGGGAGADAYAGTWSPETNTPTLVDGTGLQGTYYICSDGGDGFDRDLGSGTQRFSLYDGVIYRAGIWVKQELHPMPQNLVLDVDGRLVTDVNGDLVWVDLP